MFKKANKDFLIYSNNKKILELVYKILLFLKKDFFHIFKEIQNKSIYIETLSKDKIKELKRKYFNLDIYTDTITLVYEDSIFIFICLNVIYNNSKKYGTDYKQELIRVLIHSLLHAANFPESNEIIKLQEEILQNFLKCYI
ncbi:MAG: rRNA maturation RNAse YbeY [bacterium]|nr:rRNA maturation RNAse YbeY [bacterium]